MDLIIVVIIGESDVLEWQSQVLWLYGAMVHRKSHYRFETIVNNV